LAVKYLAGDRLIGTAAERTALTADVAAISDTDLKAYWKFNEASGDIINVSSSAADLGSGADLQVTGADYDTGSPPTGFKSMNFNGSSDKAIAGTSLSQWNFMHSTTAQWTAVFWMKADSVTATQQIFGTNRLTSAKGFGLLSNTNGSFSLLGFGGGTQWYGGNSSASYVPDTTTWHMYTVTLDLTTSNGLNYTRDGANAHNVTNTSSGAINNGDSGEQMTIGVKPDYGEEYLDGQIMELSIWDRILTSTEITTLYNSGNGTAIYSPTTLNLPNGAIFEESDTGKHYMFDGTSTWNEVT